jgi:hypothetical protein
LSDLIGTGGQRRQRVECEACVFVEGAGIGRVQAGKARRGEPIARSFPLTARGFQAIALRHQLSDLGDDTVLFGERWDWHF